ncbi:MAG TPA: MtrB/PioB family outer membrane beta-barrel protein, partial [Thermoanaerobaculia bacterium]|nr:MtrB/PioB family outer membrane beta-barrel protein [Thermoanaerobaculia bacterium]
DWEVTDRSNLGFSYHRKGFEREFREIEDSEEDVFKLSFDTRPNDRVTVRASWEFGDRSIDQYLVEAQHFSFLDPGPVNNIPGLRKFDEAAREFDDFEASVFVFLSEDWNLNIGISGREEDYDESEFGLITDEILQYSADLSYAPSEDLSLYLFGHRAERESFQRARQSGATPSTDPRNDWTLDLDEATDTWGVGINGSPNNRWTWDLSGNWSRSDGEADFFTPPGGTPSTTVDFDNYEDIELTALVLRLDYAINPRAKVGLLYRYEDYTIDSFNLQGLRPYLPSTMLLVANDGDYQADVFGIYFSLDL